MRKNYDDGCLDAISTILGVLFWIIALSALIISNCTNRSHKKSNVNSLSVNAKFTSTDAPSTKKKSSSSSSRTSSSSSFRSNSSVSEHAVFVSHKIAGTNGVGNDWIFDYKVNGMSVNNGQEFSFTAGDLVTFEFTAIENDPDYPDKGSKKTTKIINQSDIDNGFTVSIQVTVVENNGHYKGRSCTVVGTFQYK